MKRKLMRGTKGTAVTVIAGDGWGWEVMGNRKGRVGGDAARNVSRVVMQDCARPREKPEFYPMGSGGILTQVARSTQVFLKGHSGCYMERGLGGQAGKQ